MTDSRAQERQIFLAKHGFASADVTFVAGDASFRKYYRVTVGEQSFILMDAPPADEDVVPFVGVANCLLGFDYSVPTIFQMDKEYGFLLLGDLGDDSFNIMMARDTECEVMLYENAVDLLVDLQAKAFPDTLQVSPALSYKITPYSSDILLSEARLLPQWTLTSLLGVDAERDKEFDKLMAPLFERVTADKRCLTLRDYHADNLMWLPERKSLARVGLLDFQDALIGHPAYDLVSLLQDARRDVSPALEETMIKRFIGNSSLESEENFRAVYAILGAQRNAKIVGIFTQLYLRDGKDAYLSLIPRVWALLERNFWLEDLAPLKAWLDMYVPLAMRREVMTPTMLQREV